MNILVTGSNGQLGSEINDLAVNNWIDVMTSANHNCLVNRITVINPNIEVY